MIIIYYIILWIFLNFFISEVIIIRCSNGITCYFYINDFNCIFLIIKLFIEMIIIYYYNLINS